MTEPSGLAAALAALQAQLPHVGKDATNPHFKSKYATLGTITAALFPIMSGLGLSFVCLPTAERDGGLCMLYELRHVSGEVIRGEYPLPGTGNSQQIGSAITYARRYALCAVTGLAPDDDDDGNEASGIEPKRSARSLTPAQQRAARVADPDRGKTPTEQREARARRPADSVGPRNPDAPRSTALGRAAEQERVIAQTTGTGHGGGQRTTGPLPDADNAWQGAAPEDRPGTASPGQKRAIEALLTKLGCATGRGEAARAERHAVVLKYLPALPALESMNHLAFNEAATVIRGLSADTGDEKMPQVTPDHAQAAANDWPEDWPT